MPLTTPKTSEEALRINETPEEIKIKHQELLIQLKKYNKILKEIKLASNNIPVITTANKLFEIINISNEDFLKKSNKTKNKIYDTLNELEQYSFIPTSILNEECKRFNKIRLIDITQRLKNFSLQKDQRNKTPKEIKLTNHNIQATDITDKIPKTMNISYKDFLEMSYENRWTFINELTTDSSYDKLQIKRKHFMELYLFSMAVDLYLLSETNESRNFTPIVKKDERDDTTKLVDAFITENPEKAEDLLIKNQEMINENHSYDYPCNNSPEEIKLYLKDIPEGVNTGIANTPLDNKITEPPITEDNSTLHNHFIKTPENHSTVTYTHTQKNLKIKKSVASGIGFVIGSFLGIAITMFVTALPLAFTFASALVGAIIGYGVATLYEKVSEKKGKNAEVNTHTTTLKNILTPEGFKENSNELKANEI